MDTFQIFNVPTLSYEDINPLFIIKFLFIYLKILIKNRLKIFYTPGTDFIQLNALIFYFNLSKSCILANYS